MSFRILFTKPAEKIFLELGRDIQRCIARTIAALLILFRHRDRLQEFTAQLLCNLWTGDDVCAAEYLAKHPKS